jgi:hypothetical protein
MAEKERGHTPMEGDPSRTPIGTESMNVRSSAVPEACMFPIPPLPDDFCHSNEKGISEQPNWY